MTITADQAVRLLEIAQRHSGQLYAELIRELSGAPAVDAGSGGDEVSGNHDPGVWQLSDEVLSGGWREVGRETGETYRWPDGNVDYYGEFVRYRGTGDFGDMDIALGYREGDHVVGFLLERGGKRGLTWFYPADDFVATRERISLIRGGGETGRAAFGVDETLPGPYEGMKTEPLKSRVQGKWNRLGVVAHEDDRTTMLTHTALQARLRGLA